MSTPWEYENLFTAGQKNVWESQVSRYWAANPPQEAAPPCLPVQLAQAIEIKPDSPQLPTNGYTTSFGTPGTISLEMSYSSTGGIAGVAYTWKGYRRAGDPYPREFQPDQGDFILREEFSSDGTSVLAWCRPGYIFGGMQGQSVNYTICDEVMTSASTIEAVLSAYGIQGDTFLDLTGWDNDATVEPERRDPLPEVEIMIKYVKHSKSKVKNPCKECGTKDLFWAHELPEGVIVTGDEEDYCERCDSTGMLQLIDAEKTPTGKYKLHVCTESKPEVPGADGQETTDDAPACGVDSEHPAHGTCEGASEEQAEAPAEVKPESDPVGSGTTGEQDPWLNPDAQDGNDGNGDPDVTPTCPVEPDGNHVLDMSGTCMSCGEDVEHPNTPPPPSSTDEHTHPDYVTKPEMKKAFENFDTGLQFGLQDQFTLQKEYVDKAIKGIETGVRPIEVSISHDNEPAKPLPGLHHFALPDTILMLTARLHVLMVGEKGVGKGKIARQAAEALNLPFYSLPGSLSPQTPVSALIGYMNSSGNYTSTLFRQAFEHGGVMFLDELDNAHPACMAAANDALAINPGEWLAFPDGMVQKHPDFVCVAAANTFGRGPDQQYAARQRGDAATWDRFCMLVVGIDEPLEMTLCSRTGASATVVSEVLRFIRTIRKECERNKMPLLHGPRTTIDMCKMIRVGLSVERAIDARVRRGMSDQDWEKITSEVRDIEL